MERKNIILSVILIYNDCNLNLHKNKKNKNDDGRPDRLCVDMSSRLSSFRDTSPNKESITKLKKSCESRQKSNSLGYSRNTQFPHTFSYFPKKFDRLKISFDSPPQAKMKNLLKSEVLVGESKKK